MTHAQADHITVKVDEVPWLIDLYREWTQGGPEEMACPGCGDFLVDEFKVVNDDRRNTCGERECSVAQIEATCGTCGAIIHCAVPHWLWWTDKAMHDAIAQDQNSLKSGRSVADQFKADAGYDLIDGTSNSGYRAKLR